MVKQNQSNKSEKWMQDVCVSFDVEYENVVLTPISSSYKKVLVTSENFQEVSFSLPHAGRLKVKRVIGFGGNDLQEITTSYSFQAYKNVWVVKKKIRAGELIGKTDVFRKTVNVAPFIGVRSFDVQNPEGMIAMKALTKGAILHEAIISVPSIIRMNDKVVVVVYSGGLKIRTLGVALENGTDLHDDIKVRIIDTGAVLNGKIVGKKDVYVEI